MEMTQKKAEEKMKTGEIMFSLPKSGRVKIYWKMREGKMLWFNPNYGIRDWSPENPSAAEVRWGVATEEELKKGGIIL